PIATITRLCRLGIVTQPTRETGPADGEAEQRSAVRVPPPCRTRSTRATARHSTPIHRPRRTELGDWLRRARRRTKRDPIAPPRRSHPSLRWRRSPARSRRGARWREHPAPRQLLA